MSNKLLICFLLFATVSLVYCKPATRPDCNDDENQSNSSDMSEQTPCKQHWNKKSRLHDESSEESNQREEMRKIGIRVQQGRNDPFDIKQAPEHMPITHGHSNPTYMYGRQPKRNVQKQRGGRFNDYNDQSNESNSNDSDTFKNRAYKNKF